MYLIGIDIGTTSVAGTLIDHEERRIVSTLGVEHKATLDTPDHDMAAQDPKRLIDAVFEIKERLVETCSCEIASIAGISLTGQVHGIVYFDGDGQASSPAYTWQDTRGNLLRSPEVSPTVTSAEAESWTQWASRTTGYSLPPGYGFLTHAINHASGLVPDDATGLASIIGYAGMRLTSATHVLIDPTDAHALGLFNLSTRRFDPTAPSRMGITPRFIPEVVPTGTPLGRTEEGIIVFVGPGDNQAGFIGAIPDPDRAGLVNVGTSAQFSACNGSVPTVEQVDANGLEVRPFPGEGFILTGASITGGNAYTILENLYREICLRFAGSDPGPLISRFFDLTGPLKEADLEFTLRAGTQFRGTRADPATRGWISGINTSNFTHDQLVLAFTRGIAKEIATFVSSAETVLNKKFETIVGVGNAIRRNALLRSILSQTLGVPVVVPEHHESAALGAAIVAGVGAGLYRNVMDPTRPITYTTPEKRKNQ